MSGSPAILFHNAAIAGRLDLSDLGAGRIVLPDAIADGVPPDLAESIEVLVSGGEPLANRLVDALPRLRLVACFSTGYAGIDLHHLRSRGVRLTTAGGVNAHDVADHAVALLLGWWHGLVRADQTVRSGGWREGLTPRGSLRGRRAGIVGLGRIGLATARRLLSHEMEVRWWGPRDKPGIELTRAPDLKELARWCDALIVTSRPTPEAAGQIDGEVLQALGPEGVLVNVSRGMLVDEGALRSALRAGAIAGAALDVFADEPTDPGLWRDMPNILLSPHLAGFTREAGPAMFGQLKENIRRYLAGEELLTPVEDAI